MQFCTLCYLFYGTLRCNLCRQTTIYHLPVFVYSNRSFGKRWTPRFPVFPRATIQRQFERPVRSSVVSCTLQAGAFTPKNISRTRPGKKHSGRVNNNKARQVIPSKFSVTDGTAHKTQGRFIWQIIGYDYLFCHFGEIKMVWGFEKKSIIMIDCIKFCKILIRCFQNGWPSTGSFEYSK